MKQLFFVFIMSFAAIVSAQDIEADLDHLRALDSPDNVQKAIRKALGYLAKKQHPQTGAISDNSMQSTMTALSVLAFLSNGYDPGEPTFGATVRAAVLFLVARCEEGNGYFGNEAKKGRMYIQAICTMALCESFGMMPTVEENRRVGKAAQQAVSLIVNAQVTQRGNHLGGWHYEPKATNSDLSVSVWQIMALRSALNCNIEVPDKTVQQALAYVRGRYNRKHQAFTYDGNRVTQSMRAAGCVALLVLGAGNNDEEQTMIRRSFSSLINYNPAQGSHFYCQSYYLAIGSTMMGENYVKQIRPQLTQALLKLQESDGSFKKHSGQFGGVYSTAFAVVALSVRRQLLPVIQR